MSERLYNKRNKMPKMTFKNKANQKIISAILIVAILAPAILFAVPKKAQAFAVTEYGWSAFFKHLFLGSSATSNAVTATQTTAQTALSFKQEARLLLQEVLRIFARRLLAKMTESTVNWINSGFHGQPLFLERPESFFKDIAKFEIKNLINTIGYDSNRFPFGKAFALNIIQSYKSTFESNAQYSLSKVINDPVLLNNFRNDFSVGGWNGFLLNTQYPQNNYIGAQIVYSNELAARLANNPVSNNISKVQDTLQKGMGFLSPQTCPDNPRYNNLKNEFHINSFKCSIALPNLIDCSKTDPYNPAEKRNCDVQNSFEKQKYDNACAFQKKEEWDPANTCPGGLVDATPGSVVASHITRAINSPFFQTELAQAMGNSLSAIFDALLNKFLSSGLNALTSKKNTPPPDDFEFFGQTLGSPNPSAGGGSDSGRGFDWTGPDQVVVLADLKRNVQNLLDNANRELKLIDNSDASAPGVTQVFGQIFSKTQELDMCLPGPNIGWQERMGFEVQRAGGELQAKGSDPDPEKASAATEALNELAPAVASFKEWVSNKIDNELTSSTEYLDAVVNSVNKTSKQADAFTDRKNVISETLIKLQSIKTQLDTITTQPAQDSEQESTMVRLKQRLDGMLIDLSTASAVTEMQNNLDDAKDKLTSLNSLITKCAAERTAKGWSVPGGEVSSLSGKTEKEIFCSLPLEGGYSHKSFVNRGRVTHPEIPLVNATDVYPPSGIIDPPPISITLSCDAIYRTNITDYKKSNPVP